MSREQFDEPLDILPYLQTQETRLIKAFDANDWICQSWPTRSTMLARR
jgi:homoserine O-acetyltransferase